MSTMTHRSLHDDVGLFILLLVVYLRQTVCVTTTVLSLRSQNDLIGNIHSDNNRGNETQGLRSFASNVGPGLLFDDAPCIKYGWPYGGNSFVVCGEQFCNCTDVLADCSGHQGKLTYIPLLPDGIVYLNFSLNNVSGIERGFFVNVTHITHLDLTLNFLDIRVGAFDLLTELTHLLLPFNDLEYTDLAPVLSVSTLEFLDLRANRLGPVPENLFRIYRLDKLKILCLAYCELRTVNMTTFMPLKSLETLDLSMNLISSYTFHTDNAYVPQLTRLYMLNNYLSVFLPTCENCRSVFPNLIRLFLEYNSLSLIRNQYSVCLPRLSLLDLISNSMPYIWRGTFNQTYFPSLQVLLFGRSPSKVIFMENYAFNNSALLQISFDGNLLDFSLPSIDADSFAGCPNLSTLILDGNDFSGVSDEKFSRLFSSIPRLEDLSLTDCKIGHVSSGMFSSLEQLKKLFLDSNKLTFIPDRTFDALEKLDLLTLSRNRISIIKESTFGAIKRAQVHTLDLSYNPFSCTCELRWFQRWLTTDGRIQFKGPYLCENLADTTVQEFYVVDQSCLLNPETSKFITATIVMILLSLSVCTTLYRYRWHLRLILYDVVRGPEERWRRLQRLQQPFKYDIFVSFDSDDLDWVRAHLMPELEGRLGLKLCIHERDFIPGKHIVDNIADCVKASKKVMMLFSSNFAKSQWCQFELAMCLSHVLETDDVLLIVMLHDVPSRDLTAAMMAVMKTTTYIEWADEPEARASFWGRMQIALNEILPAV